jgi:hypothetical protein
MILSHFTSRPFRFDKNRVYNQEEHAFKPSGLWLSDEKDYGWKKWCTDEGFGSTNIETKFLVNTNRVLILDTNEKIIKFDEEYSKKYSPTDTDFYKMITKITKIDWRRVAREYDGIIIAPYSRKLRTELFWYNPWDCASGCIWNLSCLTQIE